MAEAWDLNREMVLSSDEVDALMNQLQLRVHTCDTREQDAASLDELIITTLILSGLRNSEFCRLRLADSVVGAGESVLVVRAAQGVSRRVYVPGRVSALVESYVENVRPRWLPSGVDARDPEQRLIFNERRRAFDRTGLYRRVVTVLRRAGLGERASVQLLRHTYGYLAYLRTGGNLLFVQRQLGHAHPRITSVYARLVEESYADLAERVDAVGGGPSDVATERRYKPCRPAFDCETD